MNDISVLEVINIADGDKIKEIVHLSNWGKSFCLSGVKIVWLKLSPLYFLVSPESFLHR